MNKTIRIATIAGGLAVAAMANATIYSYTDSTARNIPDNSTTGVASTFNVTDDFIIKEIQVSFVGLKHTWVGDIMMYLDGPVGDAMLLDRVGRTSTSGFGNSGDLLAANTYSFSSNAGPTWTNGGVTMPISGNVASGNYASTVNTTVGSSSGNFLATLDSLIGTSAIGTWNIIAYDLGGGDTGGWTSATLSFNGNAVPEPASMTALALGLGALAARRRRK